MPEELYVQILGSKTPVQLFESLAFNIPLAFTDRQSLLEAPSVLDNSYDHYAFTRDQCFIS